MWSSVVIGQLWFDCQPLRPMRSWLEFPLLFQLQSCMLEARNSHWKLLSWESICLKYLLHLRDYFVLQCWGYDKKSFNILKVLTWGEWIGQSNLEKRLTFFSTLISLNSPLTKQVLICKCGIPQGQGAARMCLFCQQLPFPTVVLQPFWNQNDLFPEWVSLPDQNEIPAMQELVTFQNDKYQNCSSKMQTWFDVKDIVCVHYYLFIYLSFSSGHFRKKIWIAFLF